jgi:hypothetical protein
VRNSHGRNSVGDEAAAEGFPRTRNTTAASGSPPGPSSRASAPTVTEIAGAVTPAQSQTTRSGPGDGDEDAVRLRIVLGRDVGGEEQDPRTGRRRWR